MMNFVLGGGCFWCLDAVYRNIVGVTESISGYCGGETPNPSYESVCSGHTGHAEVVRVEFDESVVSAESILDIFFTLHDPTQLNRQGADVGTQYRSVMFYQDQQQLEIFQQAIERAKLIWGDSVVTELAELGDFYEAEGYHQDYFAKNPNAGYCMAVVSPKVAKVRQGFANLMK